MTTQIGDEIAEIFEPFQPLPIPTEYGGVKFRSRLEARWAVFMDAARIRWAYKFEGYPLPSGGYVPDFWLPDLRVWLEIKPATPSARERDLCAQLAYGTSRRVFLALGSPALPADSGGSLHCWAADYDDSPYAFCECPECGELGIEFEGRGDRVCGNRCTETDRGHTGERTRFRKAVDAAREWR